MSGFNSGKTGQDVLDAINIALQLPSESGSTLVGFLTAGTGATKRGLSEKLVSVPLNVEDYGGVRDQQTDNTESIQKALNAAAMGYGGGVVFAMGNTYLSDTVTVPAGVTFYCDLQLRTAESDLIKVNAGARIIGRLRGQGSDGAIERLISPAGDDCHDVYLDVDVSNAPYGVHATHVTDYDKAPRRWSGSIRGKDITGDGTSRGYVFLGSPIHDSQLNVTGLNVPRHTVYLSNGASNNHIVMTSDNVGYGDLQVASTGVQPPCINNDVTIHARNVKEVVGDDSFAANLVGNVRTNTVRVYISESPMASGAVLLRSLADDIVCRDNEIHVFQDGEVAGQAIVRSDAGVENAIYIDGSGGTSHGSGSALIGVYNYLSIVPDGNYRYAVRVKHVNYNALGTVTRGIAVNTTYAATDLGEGVFNYRNFTSPAVRVVDNTGSPSLIQGWITEHRFRESANVAAGGNSEITITFGDEMAMARKLTYSLIMPTVGPTKYPTSAVKSITSTGATIFVQHNGGSAGEIFVDGTVLGY